MKLIYYLVVVLCFFTRRFTKATLPQHAFQDIDEFDAILEKPWDKDSFLGLGGGLDQSKMKMNYSKAGDFDVALASITPLLPTSGVFPISETCASQSIAYLEGLFSNKSEKIWAKKMFGANGKMPNGMMSYFATECLERSQTIQGPCGDFYDDWIYPVGHSISLGSMQECIFTNTQNYEALAIEPFKGQFCTLKFQYGPSKGERDLGDLPLEDQSFLVRREAAENVPRGGAYWMEDIVENLSSDKYPGSWTENMNQRVGICVPSGCTLQEIQRNYKEVYKGVGSQLVPRISLPEYSQWSCVTDTFVEDFKSSYNSRKSAEGRILYLTVVVAIIFLMVFAMFLEIAYSYFLPQDKAKPFFVKAVLCFSPYSNIKGIAKTTDTNASGQIGCLNGMRVISMTWVILCHSFLSTPGGSTQNSRWVSDIQRGDTAKYGDEVIANGFYNVDTFFFMSGVLVAYLGFIELEKKRFNLVMFYILRYVRLTIPLALVIGFNIHVKGYFVTEGPFSWTTLYHEPGCKDHWYNTLLYIANLTRTSCIGVTWYLMCDMQLFFCSPLVILPMYYWDKNYNGLKLWLAVITFFSLVPMAITWVYKLPPGHGGSSIPSYIDMENYPSNNYYTITYTRAQPYIYGILIGYILFKMRRKTLDIHWTTNVFLWLAAFIVGWECVFGISHLRQDNKFMFPPWSTFEACVYEMLSRLAWSVSLGWVTIACAKGWGGLINKFLSWGVFQPLAKISYMTYLTHLTVMNVLWRNTRTYEAEQSYFYQLYSFAGVTAITFAISIAFVLLFEAPFMHLQKLVVGVLLRGSSGNKKKSRGEQTKAENGIANGHDNNLGPNENKIKH